MREESVHRRCHQIRPFLVGGAQFLFEINEVVIIELFIANILFDNVFFFAINLLLF